MAVWQTRFNRLFDRPLQPQVRLAGRGLPAFQVFGFLGWLGGAGLGMGLAQWRGLSPGVALAISLALILSLPVQVYVYRLLTGYERMVFYYNSLLALAFVALGLRLAGLPVWAYLELAILGLAVFQCLGRLGCFWNGCCHGRPHAWGVCYGAAYAEDDFPPHLLGVRLFPVQLAESLWVLLCLLLSGLAFAALPGSGAALGWYTVGYGAGRFALEYWRGDPDRRYLAGASEAQWVSFLLVIGVGLGAGMQYLVSPQAFPVWGLISLSALFAAAAMGAALLALRSPGAVQRLFQPDHIRQVAHLVQPVCLPSAAADLGFAAQAGAGLPAGAVHVGTTDLGIQISASRQGVTDPAGWQIHLAFSEKDGIITSEKVRLLAYLALQLMRLPESMLAHPADLIRSDQGVMHLLLHPPPGMMQV